MPEPMPCYSDTPCVECGHQDAIEGCACTGSPAYNVDPCPCATYYRNGAATVEVPAAFYDDHAGRELPSGRVLSRTVRRVRVELTPEERAELLSDAKHYSSEARYMGRRYFGLGRSAAATVKALAEVRS